MFYTMLYAMVLVSIPFILSQVIQTIMLFGYGKVLPLTLNGKDTKELLSMLEEYLSMLGLVPYPVGLALVGVFILGFSLIRGFFWWVKPVHHLRGLLELILWEF